MFIGHLAVGFAGKRVTPRVPLWTLLLAAALPDVLWCIFLLAGIEHVRIQPGITKVNPLNLYDFPWSHSLLMDAVWGGVIGGIYYLWRRYARGAWLLFAAVLSHWLLDFASHRPDMPLAPGVHRYFGLGLWDSVVGTLAVEGLLWVVGVFLYLRATRARGRAGVYGFWIVIAFLTAMWAISLGGAPPPSILAVEVVNLVLLLAVLAWAYWMDKARPILTGVS
jgi:hypothetical protein